VLHKITTAELAKLSSFEHCQR